MSSTPSPRAFTKPWLSCPDQVALLQSRGLTVRDPAAAAEFLSHVNYYRFSGYCLAFETTRHSFLPGVTFEQVRESYDFDRVLRDLVTEALELIEVSLRAAIAHHFGQRHGAFGHTRPTAFFGAFGHGDWLTKLREEAGRSREPFVTHFSTNYTEFPDLAVWMATEVMSFGALSLMFKGMLRDDQRAIAVRYRLQPIHLRSWMHHFVYVRNLCAHHSRLWDRVWAIKPELPAGKAWSRPLLPSNERLFATLLMLYELLKRCPAVSPSDQEWRTRLHAHLVNAPQAPRSLERMGLTADWNAHPAWT
jgi:abortive infection bacteriophage resistance protein